MIPKLGPELIPFVVAMVCRLGAYLLDGKDKVASNTWYARSAWWLAIGAIVMASID